MCFYDGSFFSLAFVVSTPTAPFGASGSEGATACALKPLQLDFRGLHSHRVMRCVGKGATHDRCGADFAIITRGLYSSFVFTGSLANPASCTPPASQIFLNCSRRHGHSVSLLLRTCISPSFDTLLGVASLAGLFLVHRAVPTLFARHHLLQLSNPLWSECVCVCVCVCVQC